MIPSVPPLGAGRLLARVLPPLALWSAGALVGPTPARADALAQRLRPHLHFDRSGQPLVTVRLLAGAPRLWVQATGDLRWQLSGADDQIHTPAGRRWQLSVEGVSPGQRRYWPVIERFAGNDPARTAAALARWQAQGLAPRVFEHGLTLGLGNAPLDTRTVSIGVQPQASEAAARRAGRRLPAFTERIEAEWVARPSGWIVARADDGLVLRARDLVRLQALEPDDAVEIGGVSWRKTGRRPRRFGGRIDLFIGDDGQLTVVETAPAEQLLEGTLPGEIFKNAPAEALKAQAVVARGQLLARLGTRHQGEPFHLCSSTHCQVYLGQIAGSEAAIAAIRATRGQLLVDDRGLTPSVYSSACGGHTEAFHHMWGGAAHPALPGVPDGPAADLSSEAVVARFIARPPAAWCAPTGRRSQVFRWQARLAGEVLSARLSQRAKIGPVHALRVLRRGRSGRVLSVEYVGAQGQHVVEGEHRNRKLLGGLKSGLWVARPEGGRPGEAPRAWVFSGGGFGHGVGLCQHGAMGQAQAGRGVREILRHYFPRSRLEQLW